MGFEILSIEAKGELEDPAIKNRIEHLFAIRESDQLLFRYVKVKDHAPVAIFPLATTMPPFFIPDYRNKHHIDVKFQPAPLKEVLKKYLTFLNKQPAYACAKLLIPVIGKYPTKVDYKAYIGLLEINIENQEITLNFYNSGTYDTNKNDDLNKEREIKGSIFDNIGDFYLQNQTDGQARYAFKISSDGKITKSITTHYLEHRGETSFNSYEYVIFYLKFILANGIFNETEIKEQTKQLEALKRKRFSQRLSLYRGMPEHELQNVADFARDQSYDSASISEHALLDTDTPGGPTSSPQIRTTLEKDLAKAQLELEKSLSEEKQKIIIKADEIVPKQSTSKIKAPAPLYQPINTLRSWLPQKPNTTVTSTPSGDIKSQPFWSKLSSIGHFIREHRLAFTLAAAWLGITSLLIVALIFPPAFLVNWVGIGVLGANGSVITAMGLGSLNALEVSLTLAGLDLFLFTIAAITTVAIATYSAESLAATDTSTASKMTDSSGYTGKTASVVAPVSKPPASTMKQPPLPGREYYAGSRSPSPNPSSAGFVPTVMVVAGGPTPT